MSQEARRILLLFTAAALGLTALLHGLLLAGLSVSVAAGAVFGALLLPLLLELILVLRCRQATRRLGVSVSFIRGAFVFQPDLSSAHQRLEADRLLDPFRPLARLARHFS